MPEEKRAPLFGGSWNLGCFAGVLAVLESSSTSEEEVVCSCHRSRAPLLPCISRHSHSASTLSFFMAGMSHGVIFVSASVFQQDLKPATLNVAEFVGLHEEETDIPLEAEIHVKMLPNLIS